MKLLLDTHILLWWMAGGDRLSPAQREAIAAGSGEHPFLVAEVSLWEIATLVARGRVRLGTPLRGWLEQATAPPLVRRVGISPAIAAATLDLPSSFQGDPADRLLVATARVLRATLVTADEKIRSAQLVPTL